MAYAPLKRPGAIARSKPGMSQPAKALPHVAAPTTFIIGDPKNPLACEADGLAAETVHRANHLHHARDVQLSIASTSDESPVPASLRIRQMSRTFGANAGIPNATGAAHKREHAVQPRLEVGPADSPLEEEADAIAEAVTQQLARPNSEAPGLPRTVSPAHEPRLQRTCAACSQQDEDEQAKPLQRRVGDFQPSRRAVELSSLAQVRAEGGVQIPSRVRAPLESALRHDFSLVRVHTGPLAGRIARDLGAEAFTSRNDIVFAPDRYRPSTPEGLGLLTHELVHTIQQRSSRPLSTVAPPIMRAPVQVQARMTAPEREQGQEIAAVCSPWGAVLCEPVESRTGEHDKQRDALRKLAHKIDLVESELRQSEGWSGDDAAPTLAMSAMSSLRKLAQAVVNVDPKGSRPHYLPPAKDGISGEDRLKMLVEAMVLRLRTIELRLTEDDPATAPSTVLLEWQHSTTQPLLITPLGAQPYTLDDHRWKAAKSVMDRLVAPSKDLDDNLQATEDIITAIELKRKAMREGSRAAEASDIRDDFTHLQQFVQAALDGLIHRVTTGSGIRGELRRLYVLMRRLEGILFREIPDPSNSRRTVLLGSLEAVATKGTYEPDHRTGPQGRHDDFFGAKASVMVFPYSIDDAFNSDLKLSLLAITRTRIKQIQFVSAIYGSRLHQLDDVDTTDTARSGLAELEKRKLFNLHSDSEWRDYLLRRFEKSTSNEKEGLGLTEEEAYRDLVKTLRIYFDSFAVHSPYNIEDRGTSYIDREFPRALSGQLIHDCGVYALRIAYMLSLVREKLGLTFHFVRLPFHFALVIRGGRGLPTLVVNNDDLEWVSDDVAQGLVRDSSEAQLAGELASHYFAPGTRLPFFTSELKQKRLDKESMWTEYKTLSARNPFSDAVADPSSPLHKRDLAYLEYMRATIDAFNASIYPLWTNTLPAMWRETQRELRDCRKDGSRRTKETGGPVACEKRALRGYRRRSNVHTITALNTFFTATTRALEAVPNAIPRPVFTVNPTARSSPGLTVTQAPATTRGLEPGLAAQGARESSPEIMLDTGLKPASSPASRVELIRFLILSVQNEELKLLHAVIGEDSFKIRYADSPAIPAMDVQFSTGNMAVPPARYLPPFARREYQIERLRW